jgi:ribosomal protein L15
MMIHDITAKVGAHKKRTRVGRGEGSGKGGTSGRGHKGAKSRAWNGTTGFGDATTWNVGTNFAWLPTKGFEIGVEVIYARVSQDVASATPATVFSKSDSNVTGRLRVERTF